MDALAGAVGVSQDQARLLLSLVSAIPLGFVHKQLPSAAVKHGFSFLVGLFVSWFVVGNGAFHVLLASVLVYAAAYSLPRQSMPYLLSAAVVLYLSCTHIYTLFHAYLGWNMDVSLIQMIFVVKASTFAFNVADGLALNAGEQLHAKQPIHQFRADRALTSRPSLLEFLSYIWYFGGVLVGPCFECREYLDFTDLSLFRKFGLSGPPATLLPSLRQVGMALLMYPLVFVHGYYPIRGFIETKAYAALPFWSRFAYFWITMTCSRFKYYFAWYLSAAGCISSGLGLSDVQRPAASARSSDAAYTCEWNRCSNADALAVELATSMPQITNNWNKGVNNWLKHYVYFRVEPPSSISRVIPTKSLANVVTKLTSAFWHGFYPAYYLFFVGAFVVNEMDDSLRSRLRPLLTGETKEAALSATADGHSGLQQATNRRQRVMSVLYGVLAWFCIFFCMNQLGMAFMLLKASWSIDFWATWHYAVFWAPALVVAFCRLLLPKAKSDKDKGGKGKGKHTAEAQAEKDNKSKDEANGGGKKEL